MTETFIATVCIDFDGVLHSYTSGWQGASTISDPPVPGALDWLRWLVDSPHVMPVIYSSRSKKEDAVHNMKAWFAKHGLEDRYLDRLEFPTQKPAAFLTVDDRAICFDGTNFPTPDDIRAFKPWNKK